MSGLEPDEVKVRYSLYSIISDADEFYFDLNGRRFYTMEPHGFQTNDKVRITITKEPKPDALIESAPLK